MATVNSFEELKVWQKSRELCQQVFYVMHTDKFAKDYALKDQINRSSGSIMNNIAEGFGGKAQMNLSIIQPLQAVLYSK